MELVDGSRDPIRVDSANPEDPRSQLAVVMLALFGQMEPHVRQSLRSSKPQASRDPASTASAAGVFGSRGLNESERVG
jgi:hypothetical protein